MTNKDKKSSVGRKLTASMVTIFLLILCLCITSAALVWATVSVEENLFHTGIIKINLNDGKPIIEENEFLFEPGMTVKKDFFIKNEGTWDVYYRIYFNEIEGGLADVLEITIKDGDTVLYSGLMRELEKDKVTTVDKPLKVDEKLTLTVFFHYPESAGNDTQNQNVRFTISADAVQTKNNPNMDFE